MCITQTNEQMTKLYKSFEKMRKESRKRYKHKKNGGDKQTSGK